MGAFPRKFKVSGEITFGTYLANAANHSAMCLLCDAKKFFHCRPALTRIQKFPLPGTMKEQPDQIPCGHNTLLRYRVRAAQDAQKRDSRIHKLDLRNKILFNGRFTPTLNSRQQRFTCHIIDHYGRISKYRSITILNQG